MGTITSKTFKDLLEEDNESIQTGPGTPMDVCRVLPPHLDPRSPSYDINRTPIQVEATPPEMVDPRSPTIGINRTPIFGGKPKNAEVESSPTRCLVANSEELDGSEDQLENDSEDNKILQPVFDESQEVEVLERSISEPDLSTVNDDAKLLRQRTAVISKSFKESSKENKNKIKSKKLIFAHTNVSAENSPNKGHGKITPPRSPLSLISDSSRSPLAPRNVDVNSPRHIVQRKQITKLGMLKSQVNKTNKGFARSPVQYQVFHDDKENLDSTN